MGKMTIIDMGTGEHFHCELPIDYGECEFHITSWDIRGLFEQLQDSYRRADVRVNIFEDQDFINLFEELELSEEELQDIEDDICALYGEMVDESNDWYQKLANAATEILRPYRERLKGDEE